MNTSGNFCLKCGCEFLDKKRKRNITGEFGKIYQAVFNENLSKNAALPRAVCASWKYQIEKAWQQSRRAEEHSIQYLSLLKRKHAQSPLSSSCGDEQTVTWIERKKKGHRLMFFRSQLPWTNVGNSKYTSSKRMCIYILPKLLTPSAAVAHACVSEPPSTIRQVREVHNVATQTAKSSCHCQPSAKKGTFVKVSSQYYYIILLFQ